MKSIISKLLMAVVCAFFSYFVTGCSKLQEKPNKEIQHEIALNSFKAMIYKTDMQPIMDTPWGTRTINSINISEPQFISEPVINEVVKRKDANGIERNMWKMDISATAKVDFDFTSFGHQSLTRAERVKYSTFLYKDSTGNYIFDNGVLEDFNVKVVSRWDQTNGRVNFP